MNTAELTAYIDQLRADTKTGKLKWKKSNPTTFIFKSAGAQLSIQKIQQTRHVAVVGGGIRRETVENYVFQAFELPSGTLKLTINTTDKDAAAVTNPLKNLYEAITGTLDQEGLDFLKHVIEGA